MVIRGELLQMTVEQMLTGILEATALETEDEVTIEIIRNSEGKIRLKMSEGFEGRAAYSLQNAVEIMFDYLVTETASRAQKATDMLAKLGASKPKSAPTLPEFDNEEVINGKSLYEPAKESP